VIVLVNQGAKAGLRRDEYIVLAVGQLQRQPFALPILANLVGCTLSA
jgi:hypothetical protein